MTMLPMPNGANPDLGITPGMFGVAPQLGPQQVDALPGMAPRKRGMFAGASINPGNAIAGFLAGMYPQYANSFLAPMMQRQQMEMQQQGEDAQSQRELKRQEEYYDYQLAHPQQSTTDIEARIAALNNVAPGLGNTYAQNYARNGGGLGLVTDKATGQQYMEPGSVSPPDEAVQMLKSNPALASQFDEVFGPGASAHILGGPTQPASGGFPQQ